jgi:predicted porin
MKFRTHMLLGTGAASAQEQGWYVSGGLGPIGMRDSRVTPAAPAAPYKIGHNIDAVMQAGMGFTWGQFRIEDELSYSNIQGSPYSPAGHTAIGADIVNLLWDAPINDRWTFSLGAGAGAAQVTESYANSLSGTKSGFAWQGIVGLSYLMAPGADLFIDYHHRETTGRKNYTSPTVNPSSVIHVITDGAVLGMRWYLGD